MIPTRPAARLARRAGTIWVLEVAALLVLVQVLPGVGISDWTAAFAAIAVIGLLNALVRPVLVLMTLPFTVVSFGLLTLLLNGLVVYAAAELVPGLSVAGLAAAVVLAFGLAATNTLLTGLLAIGDEDSFYRNVTRRLARRGAGGRSDVPGLVMLEIDGLSEPLLRRALAAGATPTLRRWLDAGTHRLVRWECDLPAQTSSSQAGLFWGDSSGIPGFRWYEKERARLVDSKRPRDAAEIERRRSNGRGLLSSDGLSCNNLLSGDAPRTVLTLSRVGADGIAPRFGRHASKYRLYFLNPYNVSRTITLGLAELAVELFEALRARVRDQRPRVGRGGVFPIVRALATVVLRDLTVFFVVQEMFAGRRAIYASFVGYDVVAHHAGIESPDALRVLRRIDRELAVLERAAREAPRPYRFVVLSDHGQSEGASFRQRHGRTLEQLVDGLSRGEQAVVAATRDTEGWAQVNALVNDLASGPRARRLLGRRTRDGYAELGARDEVGVPSGDRLVVCASGNLALVYLADRPGRVTLEKLAESAPHLVPGLAAHPGVGFLLVRSEAHGPVVLGREGVRRLSSGEVEGDDPLAPYGRNAARFLLALDACDHVGDLVVNGRVHPGSGEVPAFEEQAGSHGGLGGPQTAAFLLHPAELPVDDGELVGAASVHRLLAGWLETLQTWSQDEVRQEPRPARVPSA